MLAFNKLSFPKVCKFILMLNYVGILRNYGICVKTKKAHDCIKLARIWVSSDPYVPV